MFLAFHYPLNIENYEVEDTMRRSFVLEQEEWRRVHGLGFLGICWNSKSGCTATSRGDSLRSRAGKALLVLPFSLWKENTTLSFYGKNPYCVHRCRSKATEINTNICMVFRGPWIRLTDICSSWHVEGEAESASSWFFALLFTLTGEELQHHQHPGWGCYLSSKCGQGTTRVSDRERRGGMMESLFSSCAD